MTATGQPKGNCTHPSEKYREEKADGRIRVTCGNCGKFVGYKRPK